MWFARGKTIIMEPVLSLFIFIRRSKQFACCWDNNNTNEEKNTFEIRKKKYRIKFAVFKL